MKNWRAVRCEKITWQVYNHTILVKEEQGRVFLATERLFLTVLVNILFFFVAQVRDLNNSYMETVRYDLDN